MLFLHSLIVNLHELARYSARLCFQSLLIPASQTASAENRAVQGLAVLRPVNLILILFPLYSSEMSDSIAMLEPRWNSLSCLIQEKKLNDLGDLAPSVGSPNY